MNQEFPDVQAGFRKGRRTRDQIANTHRIIKMEVNSRKTSTSASLITLKPLIVYITTNYGNTLKRWEYHLTWLLRNLFSEQGATVRTGHGTTIWFQIGKGVHQGCILSPCLFNLYAEYIMWNARLDEAQAGIKMQGEISITSDMQMIPLLWQKAMRNWKASWWKWKRRVKKLVKNLRKKLISWHPVSSLHDK